MLFLRLLLFRLSPLLFFVTCKEQKQKKLVFVTLAAFYILGFLLVCWKLVCQERWKSLGYIVLGIVPQGVFYGFSMWMLFRCIWYAWSKRVWKRIFKLSFIAIFLGILTELYINPRILSFFVKKI